MMKPRGASAWWTASLSLGALAGGIGIAGPGIATPLGWLTIALAVAAIGCAFVAVRAGRSGP